MDARQTSQGETIEEKPVRKAKKRSIEFISQYVASHTGNLVSNEEEWQTSNSDNDQSQLYPSVKRHKPNLPYFKSEIAAYHQYSQNLNNENAHDKYIAQFCYIASRFCVTYTTTHSRLIKFIQNEPVYSYIFNQYQDILFTKSDLFNILDAILESRSKYFIFALHSSQGMLRYILTQLDKKQIDIFYDKLAMYDTNIWVASQLKDLRYEFENAIKEYDHPKKLITNSQPLFFNTPVVPLLPDKPLELEPLGNLEEDFNEWLKNFNI